MKRIKNILRDANGHINLIMEDGTTERTDAARLEPVANGNDWNEINKEAATQARDILAEIERENRKQKEDDENRATCKRIAEELEAYAGGDCVKCPHCGALHYRHDFDKSENEDGETVYTCPDCGEEVDDPDDLETLYLYNYFEENKIYNIEFRIDGSGDMRSVEIMIGCGGPNIYIDTERRAVVLRWWGSSAEFPIECADAVDEWAAEMWEAQQ